MTVAEKTAQVESPSCFDKRGEIIAENVSLDRVQQMSFADLVNFHVLGGVHANRQQWNTELFVADVRIRKEIADGVVEAAKRDRGAGNETYNTLCQLVEYAAIKLSGEDAPKSEPDPELEKRYLEQVVCLLAERVVTLERQLSSQ